MTDDNAQRDYDALRQNVIINASNAGVTAVYDVVQDRLRLSASTTGPTTIGLEDKTGNFLAATGAIVAATPAPKAETRRFQA